MRYDLSKKRDREAFKVRVNALYEAKAKVDVSKPKKVRTYLQNRYWHLLLKVVGLELGYTLAEAKFWVKTIILPEIFIYDKRGLDFVKSSADLTREEQSVAIEKLLQFGDDNDIRLPRPEDEFEIAQAEDYVESYENKIRL